MESEIFKVFAKTNMRWFSRNSVSNYILSFMRYACKDIGLMFTYITKDVIINVGDEKYRKARNFYSITEPK